MTIDITSIIVALIGVLGSIITVYLVPWLKTKINTDQQRIIESVASAVVLAASKMYDDNTDKRNYALSKMEATLKTYGITLSADELRTAMEAALKEIEISCGVDWQNKT